MQRLGRNGIEPAPERGKRTTWSAFLKPERRLLAASDFFSVEVWTPRGLITYYVLFVMSMANRVLHVPQLHLRQGSIDSTRRGQALQ